MGIPSIIPKIFQAKGTGSCSLVAGNLKIKATRVLQGLLEAERFLHTPQDCSCATTNPSLYTS